jgi:hypothetical protein
LLHHACSASTSLSLAFDVDRNRQIEELRWFISVMGMILGCAICQDDTEEARTANDMAETQLSLGMIAFPPSLMGIPKPHVNSMSFVKLIGKKVEIKTLLKWHVLKYQKVPHKADKEQIQVLYDYYRAIKKRIAILEVGGSRQDGNWLVVVAGGSSWVPDSTRFEPHSAYDVVAEVNDLAELFAAKRSLHSTLSKYERDFHKINGRQVSSSADIKPIAPMYKKYRTIKKMIRILTDAR